MEPEDWEELPLQEVADIRMGKTITSDQLTETGVPVYSASQGEAPWGYIEEPPLELSRGAIVLGARGTIGRPRLPDHDRFTSTQTTIVVQPRERVVPAFLKALLEYHGVERLAAQQAVPMLTVGSLSTVLLQVPPLPEQKKIAAILSSVDDAIAAIRRVIEQTKRVRKGLLQTLMTRGMGHTRFKKTEIGEIPEEWEVVRLSDLAALQTGPFGSQLKASEYTEEGVPVIMPSNLARGSVDPEDIARVPPEIAEGLAKHRVEENDLVFARRGDIGRSALISADEKGWLCGTGCLRARPEGRWDASFLFLAAARHWSCQWLEANALGQTMLNLNTTILGGLPLPLPPLEEQRQIADTIRGVDRQTDRGLSEKRHLEVLKRGLMQDLLTGRVRVRPD